MPHYVVVALITLANGDPDTFGKRRFESYAEASDYAEELRVSILPEMGGLFDWQIRLVEDKKLIATWSMDDEQPYYEHRILIRDNVDAAHYKTHLRFVKANGNDS